MKSFYNSKSMRERLLMLVFLLIGVLWWGSALIGRVREEVVAWNATAGDAKVQRDWQERAGVIAERTAQAAGRLDAARTMSATQAYAEVGRLAQGLPIEMGAQRTDRTDNFAIHSLQVSFRRVDMAGLLRFYEGVASRAPYVGIDQCTISADRATPGMVNAVFRVYSIEAVVPAAAQ
ncbi:MAG TPA: hypothetical protein VHN79_08950 [Lacunisphaera sp.]|nr:hypothetical protein [Lacunisphaera sp.]